MNNYRQRNNNSLNKLGEEIFFENLIANLLSNEIINQVSPSRKKSVASTEFIITKIVEIDENQQKILSELDEIKKTLKKEQKK